MKKLCCQGFGAVIYANSSASKKLFAQGVDYEVLHALKSLCKVSGLQVPECLNFKFGLGLAAVGI